MKRAAFAALAALHLLAVAVVYVVLMPLLLLARGVIVVCSEATHRPVLGALAIVAAMAALLLTGCGGGDEELPCPSPGERFERGLGLCPDPIGPPDCRNRPEVCQ
jgi:hypothetical protein